MASFSQDITNAVQIAVDKAFLREPILGSNRFVNLFKNSPTREKARTKQVIDKIRWDLYETGLENVLNDDFTGELLPEVPFTINGAKANPSINVRETGANDNVTTPTPNYTFPSMRRVISSLATGHVNVPLPRKYAKVLGDSVPALSKLVMPLLQNGGDVLMMQLVINALLKPMVENPRFDQAGSRSVKAFPLANNFLAPVAANDRALLTDTALEDLIVHMANACRISITTKMGNMPGSFAHTGAFILTSNMAWTQFVKTNAAKFGNRDTFGKDITFQDYGTVKSFKGLPVITIPDDSGLGHGDTGADDRIVGRGKSRGVNRQTDYMTFGVAGTDAADGDASTKVGSLWQAQKYPRTGEAGPPRIDKDAGEEVNSKRPYSNEKLWQFMIIYPSAFDFREATQFNVKPTTYPDPQRSLEQHIYASMGLDSLKIFPQGMYRVWFSGPDYQLEKDAA